MDFVFVAGAIVTLVTLIPVALQIRKHPPGLLILFFAEMWERFSYYGMRGLLVFFMTRHLLYSDGHAADTYGAYTSLIYMIPIIGGLIADRFLGARKAVIWGAVLLVAGHLSMAAEGPPARQVLHYGAQSYSFQANEHGSAKDLKLIVGGGKYSVSSTPTGDMQILGLPNAAPLPKLLPKGQYSLDVADRNPLFEGIFYVALALIIIGVGFFKSNITALVGKLYPQGDPRRDPGYTLYYYGINLGALWAAVICGRLGESFGWAWGFGAAGIGMASGLLVFVLGKKLLEGHGEAPVPAKLTEKVGGLISKEKGLYVLSVLAIPLIWLAVQNQRAVSQMLGVAWLAVLAYTGWMMATQLSKKDGLRLVLAFVLIAASVVFWALFEQAGSSMNLFAERNTDLSLPWGLKDMAPEQMQAVNSSWLLIFAPVFAGLWAMLGRINLDLDPVMKFAVALVQVGASFFLLVWGGHFVNSEFKEPLIFLLLAYLVQTTGELCLSPVGLSWMTKLAPPVMISTIMATWYLGTSGGVFLAGVIAKHAAVDTVAGQVLNPKAALDTYLGLYTQIGLWTIGFGILLGLASPWLKKLAGDTK